MAVEQSIPLVEEILGGWQDETGKDTAAYKNHVYRMLNFCFALRDFSDEDRHKITIAGCFHDLGIWSAHTFDYLPPSIALAQDYLRQNGLEPWIPEIELIIDQHHKLTKYRDAAHPLVEPFRQADLVDLTLGTLKCGLPRAYVKSVRQQFPDEGFHKRLVQLISGRILKHPLSPLPYARL